MKILFIRNTDRFSGSETYDINLFSEFIKYPSLDIYFLTNLRSFAKRVSRLGVTVKTIPWGAEGIGTKKQLLVALLRLPVILPRYISIISTLEKKGRFDCICLQSMTEKIFLTPVLKLLGYKIIWTELGPIYATKMSRLVTFLYKFTSLFMDKIVTISHNTKRDLIRGGISVRKITTLYIGINTDMFKPFSKTQILTLKTRFHIRSRNFVIGFLGTVTNEKGIEDFVGVSSRLLDKNLNYSFLIIGDGPFLSWVKRTIRELDITEHYVCAGFREDVRRYLGIVDILFLPTRHYEGLPLAILEAQAMGKVVITSSMGGNPEIISDGVNGFLYTKLSKAAIVKRIDSLRLHRSRMVDLKRQARENIIDRFNIQVQAKKFVRFLHTL
jgi:glycosyltransferase involved in cell wall biosynthesis